MPQVDKRVSLDFERSWWFFSLSNVLSIVLKIHIFCII